MTSALDITGVGAFFFGVVIGWFVYFINRYRTGPIQLSDLTTLVSVLGTGFVAVTNTDHPGIFPGYAIGLAVGFFGYFAVLLRLVSRSSNFTSDWFLDGRCIQPSPPFYIPSTAGATIHPMLTAPLQSVVAQNPLLAPLPTLAPLPASAALLPRAARVAEVRDADLVTLTVVLKRGKPLDPRLLSPDLKIDRNEYVRQYATSRSVVDRLVTHGRGYGLQVVRIDEAQHIVQLRGAYSQARAAFPPEGLGVYGTGGQRFTARSGRIHVPADLVDEIVSISGFDSRPKPKPHVQARTLSTDGVTGNFPEAIAANYGLPAGLTGAGQTIALVEMGGGYDPTLMQQYFSLPGRDIVRTGGLRCYPSDWPASSVTSTPSIDDMEVQLDIEIAGSIAPGADIAVFFGKPDSGAVEDWAAAFLLTVNAAIHSTPTPAAISISWGFPEDSIDPQNAAYASDILAMQQSFETAAALNTTVLVASGDTGANDGEQSPTVDFPSCCPGAVACGGTMLAADEVEVSWNDDSGASGGGYSRMFVPGPDYQAGVASLAGQGRGVPDIAAIASYKSGYRVIVDQDYEASVGGTSAVAPLMAAFVAVANAQLGRSVGPINAKLYANTGGFNDITSGDNSGYSAAQGWDPVTGLGSPKFDALLSAL